MKPQHNHDPAPAGDALRRIEDGLEGTWELWQFDGNGKTWIGSIAGNPDIWGDELYDWMSENIDGFDANRYDFDGDSESVAVMPKTAGLPEYGWEYKPNQDVAVEMVKRPQNTRNYL